MKKDIESGGLMYKAAAFSIFIVLVILIILVSVSYRNDPVDTDHTPRTETSETEKKTEPPTSDSSAPPAVETKESDTAPPETTPPVTEPQTETTPPETFAAGETTSSSEVDTPSGNASEDMEAFLSGYPNTVLAATEDAGTEYIDRIVFLGDSTTYGLRAYKMLSGGKDTTQVWTPKSRTLTLSQVSFAKIVYPETDEELTISEAAAKKKPDILVITLGVNGVSFMKEDYFKSEYKKMVESIQEASPDTKIICQSIFPVAKSYQSLKSINNEKIDAANKWICQVADECGVKYLDTNSALRDEEGWLPENYHNGDGMHLQSNSFTIELNNIRTHAWLDEAE